LPCEANDREIRFVEINETMLDDDKSRQLIPIDFGVDMGTDSEHSLWVLDVSSSQWTAIEKGKISLPHGWKLQSLQSFNRSAGNAGRSKRRVSLASRSTHRVSGQLSIPDLG